MFKIKRGGVGGGVKGVWTMLKKTADLVERYIPYANYMVALLFRGILYIHMYELKKEVTKRKLTGNQSRQFMQYRHMRDL